MSKYGVFSGPYFPVLGLNTEIYFINFRIQYENTGQKKLRIWTLFIEGTTLSNKKIYDGGNPLENSKIIIADNLIHNIKHF